MCIICNVCLKEFKRRENLEYHMTNNVCCHTQKINKSHDDYMCKFCEKTFTTATSMYRHINHTCRMKKNEDSKRDEIYERLLELEKNNKVLIQKTEHFEKENKDLKKEVIILKKNVNKVSKITHNTTNNNIINNGIVANINLIGYGKEDLSKIDKKDILKAIQHGFDSTIKLTEILHFNPKHPEYHNVYITNVKNKYAMMFDGKDWNLTMKDVLINKIYDDKKNYIEENLDDFIESLSSSRKNALERWLATNDDDDRINKVKNEIKLLLYNKRNLITDKEEKIMVGANKMIKRSVKIISKNESPKDI
jgi:hypothetical protein